MDKLTAWIIGTLLLGFIVGGITKLTAKTTEGLECTFLCGILGSFCGNILLQLFDGQRLWLRAERAWSCRIYHWGYSCHILVAKDASIVWTLEVEWTGTILIRDFRFSATFFQSTLRIEGYSPQQESRFHHYIHRVRLRKKLLTYMAIAKIGWDCSLLFLTLSPILEYLYLFRESESYAREVDMSLITPSSWEEASGSRSGSGQKLKLLT